MPPEAETPPDVVEGPSSRFAMPWRRVWTRRPVPAGVGLAAALTGRALEADLAVVDFRGAAAFFFVVFLLDLAVAFFADFFVVDFFAEPFFAELFCFALFALLADFDFLPEARAAILDFPSRSWLFDVRERA